MSVSRCFNLPRRFFASLSSFCSGVWLPLTSFQSAAQILRFPKPERAAGADGLAGGFNLPRRFFASLSSAPSMSSVPWMMFQSAAQILRFPKVDPAPTTNIWFEFQSAAQILRFPK